MAEAIAKHRYVRMSAQKARLVADLIRSKPIAKALDILNFSDKKAAKIVRKVLESAVANAEHNEGADIDELNVAEISVNTGPKARRWQARAKGRGDRIEKPTCHVVIKVSDAKIAKPQKPQANAKPKEQTRGKE